MEAEGDRRAPDDGEWRRGVLTAAGVLGLWELDHRRDTARYCAGAAELLAGDASMAWRDLAPGDALSMVHADDAVRLRAGMALTAEPDELWVEECRVRSERGAAQRVLWRGRTYRGADGTPTCTRGIVIDQAGSGGLGVSGSTVGGDDALDRAAEHGVAAYDAIQGSGVARLLVPARALLMAIGGEIARRLGRPESLH